MGAYDDKPRSRGGQGSGGAKGKADDAPFRGYINVNLDPEQKADFANWVETDALNQRLESAAGGGINLALKRDARSGGFLASATQRDAASPDAGLVVTARGSTAALAWCRCLFILDILARYKRWEDCQPVADPDRW